MTSRVTFSIKLLISSQNEKVGKINPSILQKPTLENMNFVIRQILSRQRLELL
jgi:hypothetical protein